MFVGPCYGCIVVHHNIQPSDHPACRAIESTGFSVGDAKRHGATEPFSASSAEHANHNVVVDDVSSDGTEEHGRRRGGVDVPPGIHPTDVLSGHGSRSTIMDSDLQGDPKATTKNDRLYENTYAAHPPRTARIALEDVGWCLWHPGHAQQAA